MLLFDRYQETERGYRILTTHSLIKLRLVQRAREESLDVVQLKDFEVSRQAEVCGPDLDRVGGLDFNIYLPKVASQSYSSRVRLLQ